MVTLKPQVYLRFAPRLDRETQAEEDLEEYKDLDIELNAQLRAGDRNPSCSSGAWSEVTLPAAAHAATHRPRGPPA